MMASWALRLAVIPFPSLPLKPNKTLTPVASSSSHISFPRVLSPALSVKPLISGGAYDAQIFAWENESAASSVKPLISRGAHNAQIFVGEGESEESVVRRFRREVFKAGVFEECRRRRFFESKQDVKKRKRRSAIRRNAPRRPLQKPIKITEAEDDEEEEDNWDFPDRDVGF